ncbi:DotG/IcmE/VirB10 family protein [Acetobacter sp.]|uniref:DotG/IcmE/VirB10 family protein n=1 Tax=Acetobacter sp. TaxID=440 RepID=UPI0039ECC664
MSEKQTPENKSPLRASFDDSRSLIKYLVPLVFLIMGVFYFLTHSSAHKPQSTALTTPTMVSPAGGGNHIRKLDELATQQDKKAASDALKAGKSYTASLTGKDLPAPAVRELGDTPYTTTPSAPPPPHEAETPLASDRSPPPPPPPEPTPVADPFSASVETHPPKTTRMQRSSPTPAAGLSTQAEMELLAAWTGHPATIERIAATQGNTTGLIGGHRQTALDKTDTTASEDSASAKMPSQNARGRVLLPAGRGVYGHSVITSNSDLGKEVLLEVDTGPFRKARISGTFTLQNERLVIRLTSLMIGENAPISVSAYAVSPETAETGVASEVNEHLATRIILPAAASFVQGLGNAMMNSNTNSYSGGYGMTSFTHLNLGQQMGAAAGTMGQEIGQLLQKQTPQTATVKLLKDDTVGILFDQPVYSQ